MKPLAEYHKDDLRIALAKLEGYTFEKWEQGTMLTSPDGKLVNSHYAESWRLPDYFNDLNAVHRLVNTFNSDNRNRFALELAKIVLVPTSWVSLDAQLIQATAYQRCEAILNSFPTEVERFLSSE